MLNFCFANFAETPALKTILAILLFVTTSQFASAQSKIESIEFNLYTDSLKKGFFNYISIDAKMTDGTWTPLDSNQIRFTATAGYFKGNDLFIDSTVKEDKIKVKAVLKSNPSLYREVIIYIRKRGFDEPLKSSEELLRDMKRKG